MLMVQPIVPRAVWQPGASGFASLIFKQPWLLKPVLRNKCWKEDKSDGQSVIKSVTKSCSQMLLSVPKFFMYFYLEDVFSMI